MEEKFLFHIWDAGHLLTPLKTVSGKTLQVSYQGQYNTGRGPDFRNVIINLAGEISKGDVEIHINSYDWIAHEHHEDHHYNNVILHVVMNAGQQQFTVKENGEAVEILELQDQLSGDIRKLLEAPEPPSAKERSTYCALLSAVDNDTLVATLTTFGLQRFKNKVRRFNAALLLSDFDQVFYEGMMEALGYDKNKQNMLQLAQSIPLKNIRAWQQEGLSALELISILTCSSDLLNKCKNHLPESLFTLIKDTWERQRFFARSLEIDWQLFRIRPASHPVYRIIAMGNLLHNTRDKGLLEHFHGQIEASINKGKKEASAFASVFSENVLPGAEKLPKPGKSLSDNIYINIFLPISYMYRDKHSDTAEMQRIIALYNDFPALQENHITRYMNRYLSESHSRMINRKTILQQGLIEVFHKFCHYHLCAECTSAKT